MRILNFLEASINYYSQKEWRTSIILSSIAVEGIFAELYEEEYKKNVPDIPLGGLIKEVEKPSLSKTNKLVEGIKENGKTRK